MSQTMPQESPQIAARAGESAARTYASHRALRDAGEAVRRLIELQGEVLSRLEAAPSHNPVDRIYLTSYIDKARNILNRLQNSPGYSTDD